MTVPPKVLLIEAPYGPQIREPMGLAYIAAAVRARGWEVRILCDTEREKTSDETVGTLAAEHDVVGFSATTPAFKGALRWAGLVRRANPTALVVLGGYHGTMLHDTVLERHGEFDAVVRGEGETSFVELVEAWRASPSPMPHRPIPGVSYRHEGETVIGPLRPPVADLDGLEPPAWDLLPPPEEFSRYLDPASMRMVTKANVSSSRGCPYRCAFCSIIKFYGDNRIRYRSVDRVLDEIEALVATYGVRCIHFCDDNFLVSTRRALEIVSGMKERGLAIVFRFNVRPDQILRAREILPTLVEGGLREIELGIENGSEAALERYGKGLAVETSAAAIQALIKLNIKVDVDFILFDAFTTLDELEENIAFIKKHVPWGYPTHRLVYTKMALYPGTETYEQAVAQGLYAGDRYGFPDLVFKHKGIEELYGFLSACRRAGAEVEKGMESCGNAILTILGNDKARLGEEAARRYLSEYVLINGPFSRLALGLLERAVALMRDSGGRALPAAGAETLRRDYLAKASSLFAPFKDLLSRLQAR